MLVDPNMYKSFGSNPWANSPDIKAYEQGTYSYPVQKVAAGSVLPQNFDPMRQQALRTVNGGVMSGQKTLMSQLASSGGLSSADRQALMAQGQRQRVDLSQGALAAYDQMQAKNLYDTNEFNIGLQQKASDYNQDLMNQRAQDMAGMAAKKATNLYQQRLKEAMLERQLDASRYIARKQGA